MILNPFITASLSALIKKFFSEAIQRNGGLVTPVTRATFILLPLEPSQVTRTQTTERSSRQLDEAQTVLSDRYVAESIAAGACSRLRSTRSAWTPEQPARECNMYCITPLCNRSISSAM